MNDELLKLILNELKEINSKLDNENIIEIETVVSEEKTA